MACEELRPYLRRELGWPLTELGRIRLHKGDIAGAEEALLAAHRAGWDPAARSRAGAAGPRRRGHRGRLHPRRARAPVAGALEGAATEHRPAARAAARGAGRDRDRGRRHRPGPIGRRRAGARRRPIREQGAGRRRRPRSRKGAARRRRRGGRGTVLRPKRCDSGTKSAPRTRRRSHASASPKPTAPAAASTGPTWSAKRPARSSTGSKPRRRWPHRRTSSTTTHRRAAGRERQRLSSRGRLLVGDLRRAHRPRARPQGHALPRAAPRRSRPGVPRARPRRRRDRQRRAGRQRPTAGLPRSALGDAGEMLDARAKDAYRRRLAEIDDDIEQARAIGDTERAAQADAERDFLVRELVARGRPGWSRSTSRIRVRARPSRRDPRGPPGDQPGSASTIPSSASTSTAPSAPARIAPTIPTPAPRRLEALSLIQRSAGSRLPARAGTVGSWATCRHERRFEELDRRPTPMGEISLRRRLEPTLHVDVYEVEARRRVPHVEPVHRGRDRAGPARSGRRSPATDLDVVVGGLGLGLHRPGRARGPAGRARCTSSRRWPR